MEYNYSEEELERCTLTSPHEIAFQIKGLIKRSDRVSVIFHEGRRSFLTVILGISTKEGLVYFDIGGDNELNRDFLSAESCTFTTFVDGIRIQFSGRQCQTAKFEGETVFATRIPDSMLRLQRRELFRLLLPTSKPFTCRIRRGTPKEELLSLHDISIGGIGILSTTPLDHTHLERLDNCWMDLRESGMIHCSLEVRYIKALENRIGKPLWHMGCRFEGLSPSDETLIQRFMAKIEAEQRLLAAG